MEGRTIHEVARAAGVSIGTVSNVLNRPDLVADATREKVQAVIEELGYVRNASARQLRAGRSLTVGLVVLDVSNPFYTDVARGVEDEASANGFFVILCNSDGSAAREARYLRLLEEQRVAGALVTPLKRRTPTLDALQARGIATVALDRIGRGDHCSVAVDDVYGGRLAGEHLLSIGRRRIAFINGPTSIPQCVDRRRGLQQALKREADAGFDEVSVRTMNAKSGEEAAAQILASKKKIPTGIFCANDLLALGALRAFLRAGYRVPEDVAIIGYDDVEFAASALIPLSSIRQPSYELGTTAFRLLLDEMNADGGHEHESVIFKPELVARASTVGEDIAQPPKRSARTRAA
jgi:LacI family transcriptional regulator